MATQTKGTEKTKAQAPAVQNGEKRHRATKEENFKNKGAQFTQSAIDNIERVGALAAKGGSTPSQLAAIEGALAKSVEALSAVFSRIRSNPQAAKVERPTFTL